MATLHEAIGVRTAEDPRVLYGKSAVSYWGRKEHDARGFIGAVSDAYSLHEDFKPNSFDLRCLTASLTYFSAIESIVEVEAMTPEALRLRKGITDKYADEWKRLVGEGGFAIGVKPEVVDIYRNRLDTIAKTILGYEKDGADIAENAQYFRMDTIQDFHLLKVLRQGLPVNLSNLT